MNILERIISFIANITCETTSWVGLYEPEMPQSLVKKEEDS